MTCAPDLATTSRPLRAVVAACALWAAACPPQGACAQPAPQPATQPATQALLKVDFKDIPLQELVFLFSSLTGQNFVLLAPDLASRTLTVYAPKPVTLDQATDLFITALRLHGLRVERRDPFWLIQPLTP